MKWYFKVFRFRFNFQKLIEKQSESFWPLSEELFFWNSCHCNAFYNPKVRIYLVKTGLIHFETSFLHVAVANECTFCKKLFFTAGTGVVKWSTIEKICYRKKKLYFFFDGHQMFLQNEFIQFRTYIPVKQEVHTKLCTLMWLHMHGYRLLVCFD